MAKTQSLWFAGALAALALMACTKKEEPVPADKPSERTETRPSTMPPMPPPVAAPAKELTITSKSPEAVAAFKKGRELSDALRTAEALDYFNQAVKLDPEFAQATAYLGINTPGAEGEQLLEKAVGLAAAAPEAEKAYIEASLAQRKGELARGAELLTKVTQLAPGEWRAWYLLGQRAMDSRKFDESVTHFKKVLEVNPEAITAYNGLAYAYASERKWDDAIAAAKTQADKLASEPNPQDTYGEVLLWAGRNEEAEAAFQKALSLSPRFSLAWQGIAMSRFYRGDWPGGYAALAKGKEASSLPQERVGFAFDEAWAKFSEGKRAEAKKALDAMDASADVKQLAFAWVEVATSRAAMAYLEGNLPEATKQLAQVKERLAKSKLPGGFVKNENRFVLYFTLAIAARQGKAAEAEKALAALEEAAKDAPPQVASLLIAARGMAKWAKGDLPGAVAELKGCWDDDFRCQGELEAAQLKAGDKPGAEATHKQLLSRQYRETEHLWFARPKK